MKTHLSKGACARPCLMSLSRASGIRHERAQTRVIAALRHIVGASAVVLSFALPCGALPVEAEPAPPYPALFHQVEAAAPRLLESLANVRAAEGRADQASVLPNPVVGLEVENFGGKANLGGLAAEQRTLSINEPIELGGKRGARIAAGAAGVTAAQAQNRRIVVDFGYDLALAYVAAEAAEARTGLYQDAVNSAADDLRAAQALVDAGREAVVRAVQAGAASAAAQSDLETARADAEDALARLSALVAAQPSFTGVASSLLPLVDSFRPPAGEPPATFPNVAAAQAERQAAAQRVEVERTRAAPNVTALFGVRQFSGNDTAFLAGVLLPLPLFDRNRGNIGAALAEFDAADARLNAARAEAETGWRAAVVQANAAETRRAAAGKAAMAAEQTYSLTRTGYDAGRTPLIELITARRNLTDSQLRLLDARVARIRVEATLARLSGRIPFGGTP
jgi:cobalt-zinc-cadmium efflux system outer membrane protein